MLATSNSVFILSFCSQEGGLELAVRVAVKVKVINGIKCCKTIVVVVVIIIIRHYVVFCKRTRICTD
ncbi:hypothetical protein TrVE_jg13698 [Triparma verrucosa]|uniref:Uncharacterized protein n=1 Tax=Triparma verrucosa TaxID=1606542 RepID=A0A9W7BYQ7_9STRA|nr:hypothetical protein TrVE_jg13698 [Triparma verrucosa]